MKPLKAFGLFALVIFIEGVLTLKPAFSFTTKQFSLINIDTLLPSLSFIFLFFLFWFVLRFNNWGFFKKNWFRLLIIISINTITIINIITIITSQPRLPLSFAWKIALGEITASPLFGTGPGLFSQAFLKFRPQEFNTLPFWQFKFTSSSNEYLEILTTTGLLGFGAYVIFLFSVFSFLIKVYRFSVFRILLSSLVLIYFLLAFFIPFSFPLRMSFVLLIALLLSLRGPRATVEGDEAISSTGKEIATGSLNPRNDTERKLIRFWSIIIITFITIIIFILTQYFRAELSFKQALDSLKQNQAQQAYQKNLESIKLFPFKDSYHLTLSQTSLAWANALAQNSHLTDEEKTLAGQLLAQAVSEGKLAVTLAPNKAQNWENLGLIYKNLIGVASDSDRWSLAAFNNASQLDPVNPVLQLQIGGVWFLTKNYENASKFFQNALVLKPNFSNGFYNLALAYQAQGKNKEAKESIKQAILLTTPGSEDFQKLQKELASWEQ